MRTWIWIAIALAACEGPAGPQGPRGPAGEMGGQGPAGEDGTPGMDAYGEAQILQGKARCSAIVESVLLSYWVAFLEDGSVFTNCSVTDGYAESSGSGVFFDYQAGAAEGSCIVGHDASAYVTGGWWHFHWDGDSLVADYSDVEDAGEWSYAFHPDECDVYKP